MQYQFVSLVDQFHLKRDDTPFRIGFGQTFVDDPGAQSQPIAGARMDGACAPDPGPARQSPQSAMLCHRTTGDQGTGQKMQYQFVVLVDQFHLKRDDAPFRIGFGQTFVDDPGAQSQPLAGARWMGHAHLIPAQPGNHRSR